MSRTQAAFLDSHDWMQVHTLMIDAGMLSQLADGRVKVCVERTRAMLVLTAIHDVMKIEALLPTVLVRCSLAFFGMRASHILIAACLVAT